MNKLKRVFVGAMALAMAVTAVAATYTNPVIRRSCPDPMCFRDTDGTLTLVDYKTDHANAADRADPAAFADKLRMRHRDQLTYYREICERLFSEPIRTVLYATAVGREIPLE